MLRHPAHGYLQRESGLTHGLHLPITHGKIPEAELRREVSHMYRHQALLGSVCLNRLARGVYCFNNRWKRDIGTGNQLTKITDAVHFSYLEVILWIAVNAITHQRQSITILYLPGMRQVGRTSVFAGSPFLLFNAAFEFNSCYCTDRCTIGFEHFVIDRQLDDASFKDRVFPPHEFKMPGFM